MHFHIQDKSYQFKALPFGLSTAPMEFTVVAKEVKFLALQRGIRIHQYLDDWVVRARSHQICLQHTRTLNIPLSGIRLASEQREIRTGTQTSIRFCRLPVRPEGGQGQTQVGTLADLADKNKIPSDCSVCPVRKLMSLIGLLTATEKQVHLGRLHMRPIQWHLKNN